MEFSYKNNNKDNHFCHDCGREITIKNENIQNGFFAVYEDEGERISVLKCEQCFSRNKNLSFREYVLYSRVVGRLGPIY